MLRFVGLDPAGAIRRREDFMTEVFERMLHRSSYNFFVVDY